MAAMLEGMVDKVVQVVTNDGRNIIGLLKGFDQTTNVILDECRERVFSNDAGVEEVQLGLYILRGDNMCAPASALRAHCAAPTTNPPSHPPSRPQCRRWRGRSGRGCRHRLGGDCCRASEAGCALSSAAVQVMQVAPRVKEHSVPIRPVRYRGCARRPRTCVVFDLN